MEEAERKLREYRARKKREERINAVKGLLRWFTKPLVLVTSKLENYLLEKPDAEVKIKRNGLESISEEDEHHALIGEVLVVSDKEVDNIQICNWKKLFVYAVIWLPMFAYSVYIEFGVVFLILSGFYVIWANTRTRPRAKNEVSAYSVFNPQCEAIEGTLDAKKLEKELLFGGL